MKDRLAELYLNNNVPKDVPTTDENATYMDDFFKKVGEIQKSIEKISCLVDELKRVHNTILSAANPEQKSRQELDKLSNEIRRHASSVQSQLKHIQKSLPEDENGNTTSVGYRIQKAQHSMLSGRFVKVMTSYSEALVAFRDKNKGLIQRQLEITGRPTTDEELEEMLQSEGHLAVFTSNLLEETQITQQDMNAIESRHQDILMLEASIKELHERFLMMAVLVETQGEMVNNIETNVSNAVDYVTTAKTETKKAVRYQRRARRKSIILAIIVLVLLAIVALIVGLAVGLPKP
ncbi:syntaxin-2-like isoform X2 [Engraulis encrasicolus]|uniref:syntaxin-2-like isoform X2 n=1 Tax=Engraulis encrasicolus TaxID=184585 RepID=UPI002FCFF333